MANNVSCISIYSNGNEISHYRNGVLYASQNWPVNRQRIFNYIEQSKLSIDRTAQEISRPLVVPDNYNTIVNSFSCFINPDAGNQGIVLNSKYTHLKNTPIGILFHKFFWIVYAYVLSDSVKMWGDCFLNSHCSSIDVPFVGTNFFGDFIKVVFQSITNRCARCNNKKIASLLNFTHGVHGSNLVSFTINNISCDSTVRSNSNLAIISPYENQSLSGGKISDRIGGKNKQPKYLMIHSPIVVDVFDNETTGYAFEVVGKDDISISDDFTRWYPLFPKSTVIDSSWLDKYGVVSLPFAPSSLYLKFSSYERMFFNDAYYYAIDLTKIDCDISFDGFKWFHIFNAHCRNEHPPYFDVQY